MKELLIMRHGKSSWGNSFLSDHERPLNSRGKRDAPLMGQLLKAENLMPDLIISSTAVRALTTAEMVIIASDYEGELVTTRDFYHADADTYVQVLEESGDPHQRIMIVGHNPGMEALLENLTETYERFTTANIAHIELAVESWADLTPETTGRLLQLWRPKEL